MFQMELRKGLTQFNFVKLNQMSLLDSFFHPEGKRFQILKVAFNHPSGFLLRCSIAMAQQNWVQNPAAEAEEHNHRSRDIKVEQQEWIVVDKVKRAGHKRGDDGGPHHHHDGGGELGGVAEDRGRTPHSCQQGDGQEDVLIEVNIGS